MSAWFCVGSSENRQTPEGCAAEAPVVTVLTLGPALSGVTIPAQHTETPVRGQETATRRASREVRVGVQQPDSPVNSRPRVQQRLCRRTGRSTELFAMANFCSIATLFAAEFSATFASFLNTHATSFRAKFLITRVQSQRTEQAQLSLAQRPVRHSSKSRVE